MINFCSYFDKNYLSRFLVLKDSIDVFKPEYNYFVLALDNFVEDFFQKQKIKNIQVISLKDLEQEYKDLIIAKNNRDLIEYYFTLSPFLPIYIFEKFKSTNLIYVDSDFFFYKDPIQFSNQNINSSVTLVKQNANLKYGIFNVGLIQFNFNFSETYKILKIWSQECLNSCTDKVDLKNNVYAEQKYLDKWIFELKNLKILSPECSVLSPWDSNQVIEKNINNILAFHFHGFLYKNNFFYSGFSNYNKSLSEKILNNIYIPYSRKIFSKSEEYNLNINSIRNLSDKSFVKLRKIKSLVKKIIFNDNYKFKE
jgi:hypothetical protein